MNTLNHNNGDYDRVNLYDFFEDIRKTAMNSGYNLIVSNGIRGMKENFGSKNPIKLVNKLIKYFIGFEEYEKCAELKKVIDKYKQSKIKKKKSYENTDLDTDKRRGKK